MPTPEQALPELLEKTLAVFTNVGGENIDIRLRALEEKGIIRTLAEPNLVALNGHQAAAHLDIGYSTFRSFLKTYGAPPRTRGQGSSWMYEPRELELWHSDIRRESLFDTPGRAA